MKSKIYKRASSSERILINLNKVLCASSNREGIVIVSMLDNFAIHISCSLEDFLIDMNSVRNHE